MVVATDSMKNFILRKAGEFEGATAEGFLEFAGRHFLETYPQMTGVKMTADQDLSKYCRCLVQKDLKVVTGISLFAK